jgi:hypothetical protein
MTLSFFILCKRPFAVKNKRVIANLNEDIFLVAFADLLHPVVERP